MDSITPLTQLEELNVLLKKSEEQPIIIYKHSTACGLSLMAEREIKKLAGKISFPIYQVTVQTHRSLSNEIAHRTGIRHETPQVIVLYKGQPVFHTSHSKVRADYLMKKLNTLLGKPSEGGPPMLKRLSKLFSLALFTLLLAAAGCQSQQTGKSSPPTLEAHTEVTEAPDFALPTLDGNTFRLSDHRGKVVLLNFWATWCAPCRAEIPDFIKLQQEIGKDKLLIVGISLDEEGESVVRPFVEKMGINYPVVIDDGSVAKLYGGVYAIPTTVIVDPAGKIFRRFEGMTNEASLRRLLAPLLGEEAENVQREPIHVTPKEAYRIIQQGAFFVDVRNPEELPIQGAPLGAVLAPLPTLSKDNLPDDPSRPIVFICRSGRRSAIAAEKALAWGYQKAYTIDGGIIAWKKAGLPTAQQ